jgi:Macrocin-O-methyltransferase (TylF)
LLSPVCGCFVGYTALGTINAHAPVAAFRGRKVVFHVGFFPDTAPEVAEFCFVHLDADLYQSTVAGIKYFYPRLVAGGMLVFDDYEWGRCPGVKKAILEHFAIFDKLLFHRHFFLISS